MGWLTIASYCLICLSNVKVNLSVQNRAVLRYLNMTKLRNFATFTFTSWQEKDLKVVLLVYESWWEVCIMKNALNRKGWFALVFGGHPKVYCVFFVVFLNLSNPITVQQKEARLLFSNGFKSIIHEASYVARSCTDRVI